HPRPRGNNRREDDDGRDPEATDQGPGPAAVVRPRAAAAVRPILGGRLRCPRGAACRPEPAGLTNLAPIRPPPGGQEAVPGRGLAPLTHYLTRMGPAPGSPPGA